jgi:sugar O-acyltransferase (sialic acid O-acetyltransferase NeuD family)
MPRNIAYIGFGALGKQLAVFLRQTSKDEIKEIFFDDFLAEKKTPHAHPFQLYKGEQFAGYEFFICLGYKQLAAKAGITAELKSLGRNLTSYIHPSCIINPSAVIGEGCILYPGCIIDLEVQVMDGAVLNNGVIVSHNSFIGRHSFLAPGVVLSGDTRVGEQSFLGAGAIVSNGVAIGNEAIVAIGTVVTQNVDSHASVIGNPMKVLKKKINLL